MDVKYVTQCFSRFMGVYLLMGLVSFLWAWGFSSPATSYKDTVETLQVALIVASAVTLYLVVLFLYVKLRQ